MLKAGTPLSIKAPNGKQFKCPSLVNRWNIVYLYDELLLSNQEEENINHASTWMDLKSTILSERCQIQKVIYDMIPFLGNVHKQQTYRTRNELNSCLKLGVGLGFECK